MTDKIFVTGCTHFYHENIIRLCNRPFNNAAEMNEAIIDNWNNVVEPGDIVFHLGDFSFAKTREDNENIFSQLHGEKYLIIGNHDKLSQELPWIGKYHYYEINFKSKRFIFSHYPIEEWNGFHRGSYHLHSHTHSRPNYSPVSTIKNRLDVGWDHLNSLVSLEETIEIMTARDS